MDKIARRNLLLAGAIAAPVAVALSKPSEADTAFTGFNYQAQSQYPSFSTPGTGRSTPQRFGDTLNVLDYGADPTGGSDSTTAIQNCIDAAFGPITAPNGVTNRYMNKNIYIPNGHYSVTAPAQQSISAAAVDGSGKMLVTVGSTADLKTGYYVYITGASGSDGTGLTSFAFSFNAPHPIEVVNGTQFRLSVPNPWPATGTYSSGGVVNTAALHINGVSSGMVSGAGRNATTIECTNGPVLGVNGWAYGKLADIAFIAAEGTCCVDFNTDATTTPNTQSMTIANCSFNLNGPAIISPTGTERASFMCGWGSGSLCSEFLHLNNVYGFTPNGDGLYLGSFNALGHTIVGGAVQNCGVTGIHVGSGSIGAIIGTAFENGSLGVFDIQIDNSVGDCTSIIGTRSETKNFVMVQAGPGVNISSCNHQGAPGGTFVYYAGTGTTPPSGGNVGGVSIDSCFTTNGKLDGGNGYVFLRNVVCGAGLNTLLGSFGLVQNLGTIVTCDFCPLPFSGLPTPTKYMAGMKMVISDGPASPTFGGTASGGASPAHYVPVHVDWDGTTASWVYG